MKLDDFVKKYDGKQVEVAGSIGAENQCVDLVNLYIRDMWGKKIIEWTNAKDFPSKLYDGYEYIKNTPDGVPNRGDVIVWGSGAGGGYGHIAIVLEATVNSFKSFDQNWSTKEYCKIENHRYNNVIGWFHPKGNMSDDEIAIQKKTFEELVRKSSLYDTFNSIGYGSAAEVKHDLSDRDNSIKQLKDDIQSEKARAETSRTAFNNLLAMVAKALDTQQEENQVKTALDKVNSQLEELDDLQRNFATLQLDSGKEKEELEATIAHYKALLEQKDVLAEAKVEELVAELIKRLKTILKLGR